MSPVASKTMLAVPPILPDVLSIPMLRSVVPRVMVPALVLIINAPPTMLPPKLDMTSTRAPASETSATFALIVVFPPITPPELKMSSKREPPLEMFAAVTLIVASKSIVPGPLPLSLLKIWKFASP